MVVPPVVEVPAAVVEELELPAPVVVPVLLPVEDEPLPTHELSDESWMVNAADWAMVPVECGFVRAPRVRVVDRRGKAEGEEGEAGSDKRGKLVRRGEKAVRKAKNATKSGAEGCWWA